MLHEPCCTSPAARAHPHDLRQTKASDSNIMTIKRLQQSAHKAPSKVPILRSSLLRSDDVLASRDDIAHGQLRLAPLPPPPVRNLEHFRVDHVPAKAGIRVCSAPVPPTASPIKLETDARTSTSSKTPRSAPSSAGRGSPRRGWWGLRSGRRAKWRGRTGP